MGNDRNDGTASRRVADPEQFGDGEYLHVPVRLVLAGQRGRFRPLPADMAGSIVDDGEVIGWIETRQGSQPVVSRFQGHVVQLLVHAGELVHEDQPVAWLRTAS